MGGPRERGDDGVGRGHGRISVGCKTSTMGVTLVNVRRFARGESE